MDPPLVLPEPEDSTTLPPLLLPDVPLISSKSPPEAASATPTLTAMSPLEAWLLPDFTSIEPLSPDDDEPLTRDAIPLDTPSPTTSPDDSDMLPDSVDALVPELKAMLPPSEL